MVLFKGLLRMRRRIRTTRIVGFLSHNIFTHIYSRSVFTVVSAIDQLTIVIPARVDAFKIPVAKKRKVINAHCETVRLRDRLAVIVIVGIVVAAFSVASGARPIRESSTRCLHRAVLFFALKRICRVLDALKCLGGVVVRLQVHVAWRNIGAIRPAQSNAANYASHDSRAQQEAPPPRYCGRGAGDNVVAGRISAWADDGRENVPPMEESGDGIKKAILGVGHR